MLARLGRDLRVYGAADFVLRAIGFAVFPIYARVFSVGEFGIYALLTATTGLIALFANLGLNSAVVRHYLDSTTDPNGRAGVVSTGLGLLLASSCSIVLILLAVLYLANEVIRARYGISWSIASIALLAIVPEQVLQYCLDILRVRFKAWRFVLVSFFKNVLGVAVGLGLILLLGYGLKGLFLGALVGAIAAVPVALVFIRQDLVPAFFPKTAKRLVAYGYPLVFAGLAYWLFGSVDRWMLAELSDGTQLGLYAIAYKFAAIVIFLNTAFGQAWVPAAFKLHRDYVEYRSVYARLLSVWLFVLVLAGAAIGLFGWEALHLLTPPEYWKAAPVLGVLVMGIVVSGSTQVTGIGISLKKKTRLFAAAAWVTALVNVMLNLFLIPQWGATGAAIATLVSYALLSLLYLRWSQKLHPIPLEMPKLLYLVLLILGIVTLGVGIASVELSFRLVIAKTILLVLMVYGGILVRIVDSSAVRQLVRWRVAKASS